MTRRKLNVGVVGAGFMGAAHLRIYRKMAKVRIAAICDVSGRIQNGVLGGVAGNIQQTEPLRLPKGTKVAQEFGALLDDGEIDVIDICSPTAWHARQTIAGLEAGKHVICEKPAAQTADEAREVARAASKARGFLMPAMCMRFWPGWAWLKEALASERFGKTLAANFRRVSGKPGWGSAGSHPGGALFDLHIHDTDFVNFLFGRPEKVFSTGVVGRDGVVDHVVTQYLYARGPMAHAEGSWLQAEGFNMSYAIHCEGATLEYDFQRSAEEARILRHGKKPKILRARGDGYAGELRHFVDCLMQGKRSETVSAQDAVDALEICEAEEKSVRSGKVAPT